MGMLSAGSVAQASKSENVVALEQAVETVAGALRALGNAKPDVARALLALGVACLAGGAVDRMLTAAEAWACSADPSLVRDFVFAALAAVAPPYSPRFAAAMIRCTRLHAVVAIREHMLKVLRPSKARVSVMLAALSRLMMPAGPFAGPACIRA